MFPSVFLLASTAFTFCSSAALAPRDYPTQSQVFLPKPTGKYSVGRSVIELIDTSRTQPFTPDNITEPRRLMIDVYYPVQHAQLTAGLYMPPDVALFEDNVLSTYDGLASPNGTFEKVAMHLASWEKSNNEDHSPLVVFMPGEGTTRLFYQQIVATVASRGYIIAAIDPPYDVDIVQYPDGSTAIINATLWADSNPSLEEVGELAIQVRVEDVSFVLDQLSNATLAHSLVPNLPSAGLNTSHTAMFGHSLGGATSFSILQQDDRVKGGLNLDGGIFVPSLENGTSKPFMIMGHTNNTRYLDPPNPSTATWAAVWPALTGWKREFMIANSNHYDFSDYPILFETLGITPNVATIGPNNQTVVDNLLIGTLEGKRALDIVTTYSAAFLDFVIHGKCSDILDGPVKKFPEVTSIV
jgi:dienelactone hydrolase